jgi:hypothetical protein
MTPAPHHIASTLRQQPHPAGDAAGVASHNVGHFLAPPGCLRWHLINLWPAFSSILKAAILVLRKRPVAFPQGLLCIVTAVLLALAPAAHSSWWLTWSPSVCRGVQAGWRPGQNPLQPSHAH